MLHLVQSNKMEVLLSQLTEQVAQVQKTPGRNPLQPISILVQSPGMAQWLKIQLANSLGIAANLEFPLPSSFIWKMYQQHIDTLPDESAFTKDNMTWKLMALIQQYLEKPEFVALKRYLAAGSLASQSLRQYQLVAKIADIFDQYLVYRPDWILRWESPDYHFDDVKEEQRWQPILWRALIAEAASLGEAKWHRANLHEALLNSLQDFTLAQPLLVFGISAIPLQQLQVFSKVAENQNVIIFWNNPSEGYWGDIVDKKYFETQQLSLLLEENEEAQHFYDIGNPLLASWGKLGREFQDMTLELDLQQHDHFVEIEPKNLLQHIQADIYRLSFRGSNEPLSPEELLGNGQQFPKQEVFKNDRSFQIAACHSPLRELEVLQDYLLHILNERTDIELSDIIVMMPDVASYAPFIDAIFGSATNHSLSYAVSDRNIAEESPLLQSFLQCMSLHNSRFSLSQVLELFSVPEVLERFDSIESDVEILRMWLSEAGTRWGIDAQDKNRWGLPDEAQNTWEFGLQRLLAGYAMQSEAPLREYESAISPFTELEGNQTEILGKFIRFLQRLTDFLQVSKQSDSLLNKVNLAQQFLSDLYFQPEQQTYYFQKLHDALQTVSAHHEQYQGEISQDVFVAALQSELHSKGVGQRFLAGKINFCTLMPMRSIPFKVVCLLGMDEAAYPRQVTPVGFDLMQQTAPRRGDRSRRQDDRYLFLEALLSAREYLYVSYVGRCEKDNSMRMPSVLVTELIEYCVQSFCMDGELTLSVDEAEANLRSQICVEHPLQPFNQNYFTGIGDLPQSFHQGWLQVLNAERDVEPLPSFRSDSLPSLEKEPIDRAEAIDIQSFCHFFRNPVRAYFLEQWHTQFPPIYETGEDTEPLYTDALQKYLLTNQFIESQDNNGFMEMGRLQGVTPIANLALATEKKLNQETDNLLPKLMPYLSGGLIQQSFIDGYYHGNSGAVSGRIHSASQTHLLMWRPGKLRAVDRLQLWWNWLLVQQQSDSSAYQSAIFVAKDKTFSLPIIEPKDAATELDNALEIMQRGLSEPLLFFPESAWVWATSQDQQKTFQRFYGDEFVLGEYQDPHVRRFCPDLSEVMGELEKLSSTLLSPVIELGEEQ